LELARHYGVDRTVRVDRGDPRACLEDLRAGAPEGYDAVIEATGALAVTELCVPLTRDGGTVLIYGMAGEEQTVALHPYEVFRRELTIKGSFAQTHCFDRALLALRSGRVRTDGIVTNQFPLTGYAQALTALRDDRSCLKAAIVPRAAA